VCSSYGRPDCPFTNPTALPSMLNTGDPTAASAPPVTRNVGISPRSFVETSALWKYVLYPAFFGSIPTDITRSPVASGTSSNFTGCHLRDSLARTYARFARSSRPQKTASSSSSSLSARGTMILKSVSCASGIVGETTASVIITTPSSETTTPGPTYSNLPYSYSQVTCTATREGLTVSSSFCAVSGGTSPRQIVA